MDPTTFQICVTNHLEKLLEGQAVLINALSTAVELFQYEFQLIRSGVPHQNQRRSKLMANTDLSVRDASFQRLNACLSNWKVSLGANCLNSEFSRNNKMHNIWVANNASSEYDGEDSFTDTSSLHQVVEKTQVLQLKGEPVKVGNEVGSEGEMNAQANTEDREQDRYCLDSSSEIPMTNMSENYVKNLTVQEEISRKRAGDRRRSAYYRIRKKAAEAGLPPPVFAKLRIKRSEWEKTTGTSSDEVDEELKKEVVEDEDVGFWGNVPSKSPRKNLKSLTSDEKLLYKREMNKQRVKAFRMRKKAEKIGCPPPDFAKLRYKSSVETNSNRFGDSNNSCSSYESAQQNTITTENKSFTTSENIR